MGVSRGLVELVVLAWEGMKMVQVDLVVLELSEAMLVVMVQVFRLRGMVHVF